MTESTSFTSIEEYRKAMTSVASAIDKAAMDTLADAVKITFDDRIINEKARVYADKFVGQKLHTGANAWQRELYNAVLAGGRSYSLNDKFTERNRFDMFEALASLPAVGLPKMEMFQMK